VLRVNKKKQYDSINFIEDNASGPTSVFYAGLASSKSSRATGTAVVGESVIRFTVGTAALNIGTSWSGFSVRVATATLTGSSNSGTGGTSDLLTVSETSSTVVVVIDSETTLEESMNGIGEFLLYCAKIHFTSVLSVAAPVSTVVFSALNDIVNVLVPREGTGVTA
jgi:hypothetical protein